jgi:hypothetical protein
VSEMVAPLAERGKLFSVIVIGTGWPPTISGAETDASEITGAGLSVTLPTMVAPLKVAVIGTLVIAETGAVLIANVQLV